MLRQGLLLLRDFSSREARVLVRRLRIIHWSARLVRADIG